VYRIKRLKKAAKVQRAVEPYRERENIYVNAIVYKNLPLVPTLGQMNPFQIRISSLLNVR
jgi:hypothetical protein